ncbi:MAG TPA: hypothetical protein VD971_08785 [Phycisphaerales bacterium]|nr:hypothetical protein [Phycisphaerales bacterium]
MSKRAKKKVGRASKKRPTSTARQASGVARRFERELARFREEFAEASPRRGSVGIVGTTPAAGARSTVVPRASVGAAVQAAVSFESAVRVTAEATDGTRNEYRVAWE